MRLRLGRGGGGGVKGAGCLGQRTIHAPWYVHLDVGQGYGASMKLVRRRMDGFPGLQWSQHGTRWTGWCVVPIRISGGFYWGLASIMKLARASPFLCGRQRTINSQFAPVGSGGGSKRRPSRLCLVPRQHDNMQTSPSVGICTCTPSASAMSAAQPEGVSGSWHDRGWSVGIIIINASLWSPIRPRTRDIPLLVVVGERIMVASLRNASFFSGVRLGGGRGCRLTCRFKPVQWTAPAAIGQQQQMHQPPSIYVPRGRQRGRVGLGGVVWQRQG